MKYGGGFRSVEEGSGSGRRGRGGRLVGRGGVVGERRERREGERKERGGSNT